MAGKLGLGRALTLVPRLDDPKDIFSLTRSGTEEIRDAEQGVTQSCEKEAMLPSA
jgi:hypothetical protein